MVSRSVLSKTSRATFSIPWRTLSGIGIMPSVSSSSALGKHPVSSVENTHPDAGSRNRGMPSGMNTAKDRGSDDHDGTLTHSVVAASGMVMNDRQ